MNTDKDTNVYTNKQEKKHGGCEKNDKENNLQRVDMADTERKRIKRKIREKHE